ncbi:hypothetical protein [Levilactobacillus brevis]|uniref:hypothetical protein n=1 Tax=Levilactobacillus brevis TaxID=1580 RepID=UPI0025A2BEF1|nr:hypothetical protein [Levilactobacillus brevis]MDM7552467.1 hypothetical protein [Levilactobacillus brevis]MDM7649214.1 hypothetical protein [Levilactobacillus brevis]
MAQLLLPLALLGKSILGGYVPLGSYATVLLVLVAFYTTMRRKTIKISMNELRYMLFFVVLLLVTQVIAMIVASIVQPNYTVLRLTSLIKNTINLTIIFCLFYALAVVAIQNSGDVIKLFKGIEVAMWLILAICVVQLFYIKLGIGEGVVNSIAKLFEERGGTSITSWYSKGSYAATTKRINGLKQETGFLAAQLLIVFIPLLLMKMQQAHDVKDRMLECKVWVPMILIVIVLFQSGSTTAMLGLPIILILLAMIFSKNIKQLLLTLGLLILIIGALALVSSGFARTLNRVVSDKFSFSNTSFAQRLGSMIAMMKVFVASFGLGMGYGNVARLGYDLAPNFMRYNVEFNSIWPISGGGSGNFFAILSIVTGWLAQFGIIFCGAVTYGFSRIMRSSKRWLSSIADNTKWRYAWYLHYFVIFTFFTMFMSFDWMHPTYLVLFFALIRSFVVLKEKK